MDEHIDDSPANVNPWAWVVGGEDILKNKHHAKYDIDGIDDEVNFFRLKQLLNLKT